MSVADWWLCEACQSLNDLSARRCYSCRRRKPKRSVRASEHLNYRVVETWDGKIRLEEPRPEALQPLVPSRPPPIREPVRRSILAVAPPAPHGTRITYRLTDPAPAPGVWAAPPRPLQPPPLPLPPSEPPPAPPLPPTPVVGIPIAANGGPPGPPNGRPPGPPPPIAGLPIWVPLQPAWLPPPAGPPPPPVSPPPPGSLPPAMSPGPPAAPEDVPSWASVPIVWAPGPGPSQVDQSSWASVPLAWAPEPDHPAIDPLPPDHPGIDPPAADPWPLASVPIVPDPEPGPPDLDALAPSWPHWQDLLDVPTPDVSRLRHALEAPAPSSRSRFAASRSIPEWSAEAFAVERAEDPRPSDDPWPEQDLEARRSGPELG